MFIQQDKLCGPAPCEDEMHLNVLKVVIQNHYYFTPRQYPMLPSVYVHYRITLNILLTRNFYSLLRSCNSAIIFTCNEGYLECSEQDWKKPYVGLCIPFPFVVRETPKSKSLSDSEIHSFTPSAVPQKPISACLFFIISFPLLTISLLTSEVFHVSFLCIRLGYVQGHNTSRPNPTFN